jgi:hypothetical protein
MLRGGAEPLALPGRCGGKVLAGAAAGMPGWRARQRRVLIIAHLNPQIALSMSFDTLVRQPSPVTNRRGLAPMAIALNTRMD